MTGAVARFDVVKETCGRLERAIALIAEIPGAILILAEVVVLFVGVTFRYVLQQPLVWSDELATMLFLWVSMLGAAVAQHKGEQMRLTIITGLMAPRWRARVETIASAMSILFLAMLLVPAWEHLQAETVVTTPALQLSNALKSSAIFAGVILMLAISLLQAVRRSRGADLALAAGIVAVCAVLLAVFAGPLQAMENWNLLVFFGIGVSVLVLGGAPIAFAFGLAAATYLATVTDAPLSVVAITMDEGMSNFVLLSIPLFVLLGLLIEMTGLAAALANFLAAFVGHLRGGLSYVLIGAMYLVSGISGSKAANMASIAPVLLPEMQKRGKEPGELIGLLSASAAMGETIPPSIVLITVGSVTGVSIAALFNGGMLPAAVGALGLMVVAFFRSRREAVGDVRATGRQILKALGLAVAPLLLLLVIRTAVVTGVATATEVSTIGVVYTVVVALVFYRNFPFAKVWPMVCNTLSLSGAIMIILGTATAMAWALTQSGFSHSLADAMQSMPGGGAGFMVLSVIVFAILGSVLEGIPAVVVFAPLLFPIAKELGIDQVHYAIVMVLSMSLGLFVPPLGIGFYQACAIGRVEPDKAMRAIWPYMFAILIAVIVVAVFPWLTAPHF